MEARESACEWWLLRRRHCAILQPRAASEWPEGKWDDLRLRCPGSFSRCPRHLVEGTNSLQEERFERPEDFLAGGPGRGDGNVALIV